MTILMDAEEMSTRSYCQILDAGMHCSVTPEDGHVTSASDLSSLFHACLCDFGNTSELLWHGGNLSFQFFADSISAFLNRQYLSTPVPLVVQPPHVGDIPPLAEL